MVIGVIKVSPVAEIGSIVWCLLGHFPPHRLSYGHSTVALMLWVAFVYTTTVLHSFFSMHFLEKASDCSVSRFLILSGSAINLGASGSFFGVGFGISVSFFLIFCSVALAGDSFFFDEVLELLRSFIAMVTADMRFLSLVSARLSQ